METPRELILFILEKRKIRGILYMCINTWDEVKNVEAGAHRTRSIGKN